MQVFGLHDRSLCNICLFSHRYKKTATLKIRNAMSSCYVLVVLPIVQSLIVPSAGSSLSDKRPIASAAAITPSAACSNVSPP